MITSTREFKGIDGLRAFAIWMVVAGHIGALANTAGGIGNKIFFTLAGFFACYSMTQVSGIKDALRFYLKKIVRIIPAYWIVLLVIWKMIPGFFSLRDFSTNNSLILNMFFLSGYGHLWFTQQIMLMFFCTPFIHLGLSGIYRICRRIIPRAKATHAYIGALVLVVAAILEKKYFTSDILRMAGEGSHAQFQIWMFLFGYATALLCRQRIETLASSHLQQRSRYAIANLYLLVFFSVLFFGVFPLTRGMAPTISGIFDNGMVRTIMVCIAVYLLMTGQNSFASRFLSNPACHFFSELSYEIYLIHFFFLGMFRTGQGLHDVLSNMLISVAFAFLLHMGIKLLPTGFKRVSKKA